MAKNAAPVTRSPNFPTMGTTAYTVDGPRPDDFRTGMTTARHGGVGGGPDDAGTAVARTGSQIPAGGAACRVVVGHRATSVTYGGTLAAGPILPSVLGQRQSFFASGRYGPMG